MNRVIIICILCFMQTLFSNQSENAKDYIVECDRCVVRIGYTENEIDIIKEYFIKQNREDDFYVIADDDNFYKFELMNYLEANGIEYKNISRYEINYINIVFPNAIIKVDKEKDKYYSEFYLYQKGKKPYKLQDIVIPEDEINEYFEIKNSNK